MPTHRRLHRQPPLGVVAEFHRALRDAFRRRIPAARRRPACRLRLEELENRTLLSVVVRPTSGLFTTEAGGTATFAVVLNSQPTAKVTIPLSSTNFTVGTVSQGSLTFTPTNWAVPQIVTVTGQDDALFDLFDILGHDVAYKVQLGPAVSADPNYSGLTVASVSLINKEFPFSGISISPSSGLAAVEGTAFSGLVGSFTDSQSGTVPSDYTATITWGDGQTSVGTITANANGGFDVTGTNTYAEEGSYAVTLAIVSNGGSSAAAGTTATVTDAPLAATATTISAVEGSPFSGVVASFTDPNPGATPSDYTATIAWGDGQTSTGTVTANGTGGFDVAGTNTYAEEGSYGIIVTIRDVGGASATANSTATVGDAALFASGTAISAVEGNAFSGVVASFTDANPNATAADYTATITWGDGQTSAGIITANGGGSFNVAGVNTYAEEGFYAVTVTIRDMGGASAGASSSAAVADAGLTASGTTISAVPRDPTTAVVASFTDSNPNAAASDFTATIFWGDGQTSAGTISANGTGGFDVTGTNTYIAKGTYFVTVLISDVGGSTAVASSTAVVIKGTLTASGTTFAPTEGTTFTGVVGQFRNGADPDEPAGDHTAIITWGDGQTSAGVITAVGGGNYTVTGSHAYAEEGTYPVSVTITWVVTGTTTTAVSTATVGDAALSASGTAISPTESSAFTGVVASFTDPGTDGTPNDYTATITWGDGQTSAGTVTANGSGGFDVTGNNTYAEEGSYAVTVTIQDVGGASAVTTGSATVADAPLSATGAAVAATEGSPFTGLIASFSDLNFAATAADFTATITWGDGQSSGGTVTANGSGGFDVSGSHVYADEGSYAITVSIQDVGGASAVAGSSATVADAPLSATGATVAATEGSPFTGVVASFTDPNPAATAGDFTVKIIWGDGQTGTGTVTANGAGGFDVSGSHVYADEGSYAVKVAIHDIGGASATATSTATVTDATLSASGTAIAATEGGSYSGAVVSFTDANASATAGDFTAAITWGDGQTSAGTVTATGGGGFSVTGSKTYAEEGSYGVTVTIRDVGGASAVAGTTATVSDAGLSAAGSTISANPGSVFTGVVATFRDADPAGVASDYTVTISWGDGHTSTGTVTASGSGGFDVTGSNTYAKAGSYAVSVVIGDAGGASARTTGTAVVTTSGGSGSGTTPTGGTSPGPAGPPASGPVLTFNPGQPGQGVFLPPPSQPAPGASSPPVLLGGGSFGPPPAPPTTSTSSGTDPSLANDSTGGEPSADGPGTGKTSQGAEGPDKSAGPLGTTAGTGQPEAVAKLTGPGPGPAVQPAPFGPSAPAVKQEPAFSMDLIQKDLDTFEQQGEAKAWPRAVEAVFATGVATAGYVLLSSRGAFWLLTALTARPLWKQFDPLEVLFAWENEQRQKRARGTGAEDEETLQSLVG